MAAKARAAIDTTGVNEEGEGTIKDDLYSISFTDKKLFRKALQGIMYRDIHVIRLLHLPGIAKHELLHLYLGGPQDVDYQLRLERRARNEAKWWRRTRTAKKVISSFNADAEDEFRLARLSDDSLIPADAILRFSLFLPEGKRPRLEALLDLIDYICEPNQMPLYNLYMTNCWAFARCIFRTIAKTPQYRGDVTMQLHDRTHPINTAGLDEVLSELLTKEEFLNAGLIVGVLIGLVLFARDLRWETIPSTITVHELAIQVASPGALCQHMTYQSDGSPTGINLLIHEGWAKAGRCGWSGIMLWLASTMTVWLASLVLFTSVFVGCHRYLWVIPFRRSWHKISDNFLKLRHLSWHGELTFRSIAR